MCCKLLSIGMIVAAFVVIAQSVPSRSEPKKETAGLSAREEDKAQAKSDRSADETATTKEHEPNEPPNVERYTVLHVKRDSKWLMALAKDEEGRLRTAHEGLRPLAWLVGGWVDDGGSTVGRSTCRWSEDKSFL